MILAFLFALVVPKTGIFHLPSGTVTVSSEIRIPAGAHDLTIVGDHTTLRASASFRGRAVFSCNGCRKVAFQSFTIDGNREALDKPLPLPPADKVFAEFFGNNGIVIEGTQGVSLDRVDFVNIVNFAVLVNHSRDVLIDHVGVEDSGSRTSGGILLEDGTERFAVANSTFKNIRGNAVWTRSRYPSRRNLDGKIAKNYFFEIGRDAIRIGDAGRMEVLSNAGTRIGFQAELGDVETLGSASGIDIAGDVDQSTFEFNRFEDVRGNCIHLDGFHDGRVLANVCINNAGGVFLAKGAHDITIENNRIQGYKTTSRCIEAAPEVKLAETRIQNNVCGNE